jgi:hypothetical protein
VALNGLPTKNDGIYKDKGLQPLDDGSARMLDVLIARHERALVGRLLEQVPALALLPASRTETPSFELAIRKRDLPTLHLLLVASCRAPLPLRQCVAHRLIPRLGAEGLGAAVGTFVCDAAVQLERSGALLDLACASTAELVYQLYPSWGGVGTRLWEAQVVVRDAAASLLPPGVHVRPKRVPLPGLTSSGALRVLVARATRICHRGHHLPVFESACVRAVVEALWRLQFERLNRLRLLGVLAHLGLVLAYAACAHELAGARAQPAVEGGASVAEAVLPYAHLLLASSLLMLNAPLLLAKLLDVGRGARGGGRPASRRHRVSSFGQDVPGCALLLCAVGYELFELNDARATAGPHCRAGLSLAVRAGLVASVARQCAAVVRALAGLPQLTLTVLSLLRAAGSVLPMVLGAALLCVVLLVTSPLVHGADAQQPSDRTVRAPRRAHNAARARARSPVRARQAHACAVPHPPRACPHAGDLRGRGAPLRQRRAARLLQRVPRARAAPALGRAARAGAAHPRLLRVHEPRTAAERRGGLGVGARARVHAGPRLRAAAARAGHELARSRGALLLADRGAREAARVLAQTRRAVRPPGRFIILFRIGFTTRPACASCSVCCSRCARMLRHTRRRSSA